MKKAIKASERCFTIALHFEGCKLKAYQDPKKIWTIGIGTTRYPDGKPVKSGDTCTVDMAKQWYLWDMHDAERKLERWLSPWNATTMDQHRIDAILDFIYNVGYGETLIKTINKNPNNPSIWGAFLLYDKITADKDGKDNDGDGLIDEPGEKMALVGLTRRRQCEANLYFNNEIDFFENLIKKRQ